MGTVDTTECPGPPTEPAAIEGNVCVYTKKEEGGIEIPQFYGEGHETGPELKIENATQYSGGFGAYAHGSWAVTAE